MLTKIIQLLTRYFWPSYDAEQQTDPTGNDNLDDGDENDNFDTAPEFHDEATPELEENGETGDSEAEIASLDSWDNWCAEVRSYICFKINKIFRASLKRPLNFTLARWLLKKTKMAKQRISRPRIHQRIAGTYGAKAR